MSKQPLSYQTHLPSELLQELIAIRMEHELLQEVLATEPLFSIRDEALAKLRDLRRRIQTLRKELAPYRNSC